MLVGQIRQQVNLVIIVISYSLLYWMFSFVANPCNQTCFHLRMSVYSFISFQPLMYYGGEVLLEFWKLKDTSEKEMTRYT